MQELKEQRRLIFVTSTLWHLLLERNLLCNVESANNRVIFYFKIYLKFKMKINTKSPTFLDV